MISARLMAPSRSVRELSSSGRTVNTSNSGQRWAECELFLGPNLTIRSWIGVVQEVICSSRSASARHSFGEGRLIVVNEEGDSSRRGEEGSGANR